jgi:hypothetical protein
MSLALLYSPSCLEGLLSATRCIVATGSYTVDASIKKDAPGIA